MADFLDTLVEEAKETIEQGYYKIPFKTRHKRLSLRRAIISSKKNPIIAEIKLASPTFESLKCVNIEEIASKMLEGGAVGISILTEPKFFKGSLKSFMKVRERVDLPLLMKDIVLSPIQLNAGYLIGADAVLLIKTIYDRGLTVYDLSKMIEYIHLRGMEVLLETHTKREFIAALETEADIIGINNRDLQTLEVDIDTTRNILENVHPKGKVIVSESGIRTRSEILYLKKFDVDAFLIGSSLMTADDLRDKLEEFVNI
jgi:indole-3-glycerol phosphate synthase